MPMLCEPSPAPADRSPRPVTVELITGRTMPADLLDRAETLEAGSPFGRAAWWDSWWRHLRPKGSELFLLKVSVGDELIGLAPWYTRRIFGFGRVVRFLGDGRACSDYATVAAHPAHRVQVWREITNWVAAEAGKSWDMFILEGVSAADEALESISQQLSHQGILLHQRTVANTWRLTLPETWEEYVDLFSKQHRNRLRRTARQMFESGRAVLRRAENDADLERGFEIQCRLHQMRRKSLGDEGCFTEPRFAAFLQEATQRFLKLGSLRLQWTEVDGEPVAFDCGFNDRHGVYVYQTGFDPTNSDLSPGRLHFQASITRAIQDGHRFFDFLRGDEPYKAHFRAQPIGVLETRLIAPRMFPSLGHRLWRAQREVKSRMRALQNKRVRLEPPVNVAENSTADLGVGQSLANLEITALAQRARSAGASKTRWSSFTDACARFSIGSAVTGVTYRAARRIGNLEVINLVSVKLANLSPAPPLTDGLEYRWLGADEVRAYAADPANDLDASMAWRLESGRNYCGAVFDGSRLANYSWYALGSIEPEHSLGVGLSFPADTVYLYKAYTHPHYRGRRIHHSAIGCAAQFFSPRGISQLIAVIEYANWASLRSHERVGCRRVGRIIRFGRPPFRFQHYPRQAVKLGLLSRAAIERPE